MHDKPLICESHIGQWEYLPKRKSMSILYIQLFQSKRAIIQKSTTKNVNTLYLVVGFVICSAFCFTQNVD